MRARPQPILLLLLASLACGRLPPGPQSPGEAVPASVPRLQDLLEPIRAQYELPAAGAAVFDSTGQLLGIGAVGQRVVGVDGGPSEAVTVEDRWHLGSDTKAMTATLAARVVEQTGLELDTSVAAVLPDAHPAWSAVTLRHLLSHTGGVRDGAGLLGRLYWMFRYGFDGAPAGRAAWVATMVSDPPHTAPGDFAYSNEGYILAGHLLERQRGRSWEQQLTEDLFAPLGMGSAGFGPPVGPHPWGHVDLGGTLTGVEPSLLADNPGALGPAGTVHASLADWAKFGALHLAAARGTPHLLTAQSFAALHEKQSERYSLGWIVSESEAHGGAAVLAHDGSNTMWYARILLVPEHNRGYLFVTNTSRDGEAAADAVVSALHERFGSAGAVGGAAEGAPTPPTAPTPGGS